ncbi:MAG: hypothetical protein AAF108_01965 [Planctomycetota bacterium]
MKTARRTSARLAAAACILLVQGCAAERDATRPARGLLLGEPGRSGLEATVLVVRDDDALRLAMGGLPTAETVLGVDGQRAWADAGWRGFAGELPLVNRVVGSLDIVRDGSGSVRKRTVWIGETPLWSPLFESDAGLAGGRARLLGRAWVAAGDSADADAAGWPGGVRVDLALQSVWPRPGMTTRAELPLAEFDGPVLREPRAETWLAGGDVLVLVASPPDRVFGVVAEDDAGGLSEGDEGSLEDEAVAWSRPRGRTLGERMGAGGDAGDGKGDAEGAGRVCSVILLRASAPTSVVLGAGR